VNVDGAVVGINVYGNRWVGPIVIPAHRARSISEELRTSGTAKRPYIGVRSQPVDLPAFAAKETGRETGLLIVGIEDGSPASSAPLYVGDIIVEFDGNPVTDHQDLMRSLRSDLAGTSVTVKVVRAGTIVPVYVTLGSREPHSGQRGPCGGHHGRHRPGR
jgi:S1-C subfamily serine protease